MNVFLGFTTINNGNVTDRGTDFYLKMIVILLFSL